MRIVPKALPSGVKLYVLVPGDVFSPVESPELVLMVMPTHGRRTQDRYIERVNVVNLTDGNPRTAHGSLEVVYHKRAAVVLEYKQD